MEVLSVRDYRNNLSASLTGQPRVSAYLFAEKMHSTPLLA